MVNAPKTTASAPGKLILTGEHSVVYGFPALAFSLPLSTTVTLRVGKGSPLAFDPYTQHIFSVFSHHFSQPLDPHTFSLHVSSTLPSSSGLGSSAAYASALLQALAAHHHLPLSQAELLSLVQASETHVHGTPSGIDATTVVYGGIISFHKDATGLHHQLLASSPSSLPPFLLFQSGPATESTKDMVAKVAAHPQRDALLSRIGSLSSQILTALKTHQPLPLPLLTHNQRLLESLNVVSPSTLSLIHSLESFGATAKICGAGGLISGSGVILAFHPDLPALRRHARTHNWSLIL